MVELSWGASPVDRGTYDAVHRLVADVAGLGGAVGWLEVPGRDETAAWLDGVLADGQRLALARSGDDVLACGLWARFPEPVRRRNAEIRKVMTLSSARGRGLARLVTSALVADADRSGVEVLSLAARGNNHAALALYESLGFVVTGRRPDWIAVGQDRFDEVLLHLDLRPGRPPSDPPLVRHGSRREGIGST